MATRIKICGITSSEDASVACDLGADAIGLVFYAKSPRAVTIETARIIRETMPPMVTLVALVVDAQIPELEAIVDAVAPDIIQYHGQESHDFCNAFGHPYWKAVRVKSEQDIALAQKNYPQARALLFDAWVEGVPGGTGHVIDPAYMNQAISTPWILAGGLTSDNVADALSRYRPHAVDVSSGVELSAGVKDAIKLRQFIAAVKSFDEANVL